MLKDRLKFLLKDTALYGFANALSKVIIFLTLPIIVNVISVGDFAVWNLLTIVGLIIASIVIFGMDSAVIRYYYDDTSLEHHKKVFSNGLAVQVTLIILFLTLGFLNTGLFLKSITLDAQHVLSLQLIFVWIPANVLTQYCQNWFKWTFQRSKFLVMSMGLAVLNLLFLLLCTKYYHLNLKTILVANAVSYWLFALVGLVWCRKYIQINIDKGLIKKLLIFGFPMMLVMLVGNLTTSLDRLFLARYLTEDQLGIYSFSQKLSIIMTVVVTAFQTAFGPFAYSIWEKPDARQTFSRFQSYYLLAGGMIAIGICSCIKPLIMILGNEQYLESSQYLFIFVESILIYGLYSFASLGIFYSRKMAINLVSLCIGLSVNFTINYFLIPVYYEYGAVVGFLFGNLALVTVAYFFSRQSYTINFSYSRDALKLVLIFVTLAASNFPLFDNIYTDAFLKLATLPPGFVLLSYFFLTNQEKVFIFSQLKKAP